ncbi:MAG: serine/threonine-protein kinase, partial [Planctomycetota bacterium]
MPDAADSSHSASRSGGDLTGREVGDYQLLSQLGRGGMATVYKAHQRSLQRDVAFKVLKRELAADEKYVQRFRREANAAAKLNHPNIVKIYEVNRWSGDDGIARHFIAQEYVDGQNLLQIVRAHGPLCIEDAIDVLEDVGQALVAAAEKGIIHRDIKPENVLHSRKSLGVEDETHDSGDGETASDSRDTQSRSGGNEKQRLNGRYKVVDFGLAAIARDSDGSQLTQVGVTMGTPRYM